MSGKWPESGGFWKCWRSKNRRRRTKLRRKPSKVKGEGGRTRRARADTFQHLPVRSFPDSVASSEAERETHTEAHNNFGYVFSYPGFRALYTRQVTRPKRARFGRSPFKSENHIFLVKKEKTILDKAPIGFFNSQIRASTFSHTFYEKDHEIYNPNPLL